MNRIMNGLLNLSQFVTKYIMIYILVCVGLAFIEPNLFKWAIQYTAIFLGVAMFGMGLAIKLEDVKVVLQRPKDIILGCVLQFTIMPSIAWALCKGLELPADIAIGVILVGCCPGGVASNVITYIAKGDVALSVGMTIVSTLLAPVITPFLIFHLGGAWVDVSFLAMVMSVIKIVLLPVLLGLCIHHYFHKPMEKVFQVMPLVSSVAIITIIAGIVAVNANKILSSGLLVLSVVILHNVIGLGIGMLLSNVLGLSYRKATAIAVEVGMQNSGLAVSLATLHFAMNPLATLPGAVFSVWHNMSGSVFAYIRQRGQDKRDELKDDISLPSLAK